MCKGRFYFIAASYITGKEKMLVLDIEYEYGREPYNIGRDTLLKEGYKVKGMYGREDYAIDALLLNK